MQSNPNKSSIIDWWLQGLGLLVPTGLKNLFNPSKKQILIQLQSEKLAVIWPNQKKSKSRSEIYNLQLDNDRKTLSQQLARYSRDKHNIVLCIPAKKGLRNIIKLPVNAESDLANIIKFEIDRQTPFTGDQVYSGYRVIEKNKTSNTLNVELNVIPKKQIDPLLAELQKNGIAPQVIELLSDQQEKGINVLPGSAANGEYNATKHFNKILSLLALVLSGFVIGLPFLNLESAIKQTDNAIEEAKSGALEINELRSKWEQVQGKQKFVNEKIEEHRSVTAILDDLTRLMPDDTWLTRLHMKGESVRLQGESSAATALISIIENSGHFSGTRFQSPVTSNVSTGNDRFQITTLIRNKPVESSE